MLFPELLLPWLPVLSDHLDDFRPVTRVFLQINQHCHLSSLAHNISDISLINIRVVSLTYSLSYFKNLVIVQFVIIQFENIFIQLKHRTVFTKYYTNTRSYISTDRLFAYNDHIN